MSRIPGVPFESTQGRTREALVGVQRMLGGTPNLFRVAAQSPAALEALVGLFGATARGGLGAQERESLALTVAQSNGCDYCLSAHTALGRQAGLSDAQLVAARRAQSPEALLRFARLVTEERGRVSDSALAEARRAGATDADLVEVVANVALNVFTNYLNLVAATEIDFPVVRAAS